jgi:hypothetical protein
MSHAAASSGARGGTFGSGSVVPGAAVSFAGSSARSIVFA